MDCPLKYSEHNEIKYVSQNKIMFHKIKRLVVIGGGFKVRNIKPAVLNCVLPNGFEKWSAMGENRVLVD